MQSIEKITEELSEICVELDDFNELCHTFKYYSESMDRNKLENFIKVTHKLTTAFSNDLWKVHEQLQKTNKDNSLKLVTKFKHS